MKTRFTLFLIVFGLSVAAVSAQPRLAIISENPSLAAAADVLTTQFTNQSQLTLLERDQIQKVYREQALSAGNTDYLKLGRILGADGLLLLRASSEGTNEFLSARLVAVKPGVVLVSEKFLQPITDLPEWSAAFAQHLNRFLPKLTVLEKDAIPISVINLRSAVSTRAAVETEQQLKLLTIDRLSMEKQLFVLERQKMQFLSDENQLQGLDDSGFWSGSYLLEGIIDRDGYSADKMTINARLIPPRGGAPIEIEVSGKRDDFTRLTADLVKKVVAALKLKSTVPNWNPADEAEQYFAEAKWAERWGLYNEVESASESAWALGKKSRELAALRIRAYANDVRVADEWFGNLEIPWYPDAAKLPAALRAVNLFSEDASLMLTNSTAFDEEVLSLGVHVFHVTLSLLDGFYVHAELRPGNEDQLEELRSLIRRMQPVVDFQIKLAQSNPDWALIHRQKLDMYELAKWEEGSLIFDHPEEAGAMFQHMLEAGYNPTVLPRFIGWSWIDRKRVPQVRKQFLDDTCASTNPAVRLRGLCLSVIQTPYYPEAEFHAREGVLVEAMEKFRDWIFNGVDNAALLAAVENILRDKYGETDLYASFREEPFAAVKQSLRKAYLTTRTNFDPQVVGALFPSSYEVASAEQAQELLPLMDKLPKKNWVVAAACNNMRRIAGKLAQNIMPTPPKPIMAAQEPIMARFISWNGIVSSAEPRAAPQIVRMIVRADQLWVEIAFLQSNEFLPFATPEVVFVGINLKTGIGEAIPFPEKLSISDSSFEVTKESLYFGVRDHLKRYRRREKTWEDVAVPVTGVPKIAEFQGKLYVSTADSLMEVTPDSGDVRILASGRRTPPENEMDSLLASHGHEVIKTENQLFLSLGDRTFVFVPTNQTWRPLPVMPFPQSGWRTKEYFSDAGELFFSPGILAPKRYTAMWYDATSPQLLLEQHVEMEKTNAALNQLLGQPCWDWPKPFHLEYPCVVAEGKNLWVFHPRKVESVYQTDEPVVFKDNRDATLLHFTYGRREATAAPIRFEKDGQQIDPFDRKQLAFVPGPDTPVPLCLLSPDGLVLSCHRLMGHWLIPKGEIEKHLAVLNFEIPKSGGPQL